MTSTSPSPEHGTGSSIYYKACRCDVCERKKQAVERLVDSFSHVRSDWAEKAAGDYIALPMWSTLFVPKDSCDADNIRDLLREIECECENADDCDCEDGLLRSSGWQAVGDTGIVANEIDGELCLGIDGAGYSFHAEHWVKLYDDLGYGWHEAREEREADYPDCLKGIDGPLFREQRQLLITLCDDIRLDDDEKFLISGLVNWTDDIADYLHDQRGLDCLITEAKEAA